jgi:hypothetical protein
VVLLVLIPLVTLGSKYYMTRVQSQRNLEGIVYPGLRFKAECQPSKMEYGPGEPITLTITITNVAPYALDMLWPQGIFMLTTDPNAPVSPGYPAPPNPIPGTGAKVAEGVLRTKAGVVRGSPEPYDDIRLKPDESLEFAVDVGPATGSGFRGSILITDEATGIFGDLYDVRDPAQVFLRDGRSLVSNEFHYTVTETPSNNPP